MVVLIKERFTGWDYVIPQSPDSLFIIIMLFLLQGCTPLSLVSMAVSTTARTAESLKIEREAKEKRDNAIAIANLNLGVEFMRQENYEMAMERLNIAREARPDFIQVYDALGILYQRMGRLVDAEKNFNEALKLGPDRPDTLNNYGQFLCKNERVEEAQKYFLKAANNPLYLTPEVPLTNAGTCALMHHQTREAKEYFSRALFKNPKIPVALLKMSRISCDQDEYEKARDYLDRYDQLARHTSESLWLAIQIKNALGDKDAVSSYALLLKIDFPDAKETELLKQSGIR